MKLVREHIEFKQGGNPYNTLGIGKKAQIEKWFETWAPNIEYSIDDELNIHVHQYWYFTPDVTDESKLPENLTIEGGLTIRSYLVHSLPNNLTIHGDLDISGTNISKLPDNLTVHKHLIITGLSLANKLDLGSYTMDYIIRLNKFDIPLNLQIHGYIIVYK